MTLPPMLDRQALKFSLDDLLQHLPIKRQIRHDPFKPTILAFKLLQPFHFRLKAVQFFRSRSISAGNSNVR